MSELQYNLPQLTEGFAGLDGTTLDGELLCPVSALDTGSTVTTTPLQATMAVLAASPDKAGLFQEGQHARVRFHVFDILRSCGRDVKQLPLIDRQDILATALGKLDNDFVEPVESFVVNKPDIHRRLIDAGGEGTVWKRIDASYEPGRRVAHWIKRKRWIEVEAFVTGCKRGTNGHADLVGAVEFSVRGTDGSPSPIAWVSGLSDSERFLLTESGAEGGVRLARRHLGRRAILAGLDLSARAARIRHARLVRWVDPVEVSPR